MSFSCGSFQSGSIRSNAKGVNVDRGVLGLGARRLGKIKIFYKKTPLQGAAGMVGYHHFIEFDWDSENVGQRIRAEKVGEVRQGRKVTRAAGLHLTLETKPGDGDILNHVTINGPGPGVENWTMATVLELLAGHEPNYDVFADNCWKYAFYCAEAILQWCIDNAVDENVRDDLKRELEKLKHIEHPMPKAVWKWVTKPSDPESIKTGVLIEQMLSHAVGELEKSNFTSVRANMLSKALGMVVKRNGKHPPASSTGETF